VSEVIIVAFRALLVLATPKPIMGGAGVGAKNGILIISGQQFCSVDVKIWV
jgi:cation transport ATPase